VGTYDLTKALHLTFGGRYTKETKKFQTDQFVVASPNKALVGVKLLSDNREKESDSSQFTPRLIISADVADGVMAYRRRCLRSSKGVVPVGTPRLLSGAADSMTAFQV